MRVSRFLSLSGMKDLNSWSKNCANPEKLVKFEVL
jgi:hypothetical protein